MQTVVKKQRAAYGRQIVKTKADTTEMATEEKLAEIRRDAVVLRRNKPGTLADRIAGSTFFYVNWYYPEGRFEWPQHNNLRHVGRMYPHAEGGMLLVDEPKLPGDFENCEMKAKVLRRLGYRYLIIKPEMTYEEAITETCP